MTVSASKQIHLPPGVHTLPKGWDWSRLDDLCFGVIDCPHTTPKLVTDGFYYVVRTQDILTGVFRKDEAARVSEETYLVRIERGEPQYGDLLYSREGTYFGISAEVPLSIKVCLGQRMMLIQPRPHMINHRYLRFWLNSPMMSGHIHGFRDGSVAERLNLPTVRGLPVAVPPIKEQRAIARILGALDDKIELNRRQNATLEALACAIFQSWFVDFDPVHAKAAGRAPAAMDAATAALFPDAFDVCDGREVPRGWRVGALSDFVLLNSEAWSKETRPDFIRYVDLSNTKWGRIEEIAVYQQQDAPSRAQRILQVGDTIVGTVRPGNGSYAFISENGLTGSTGFAVLRPYKTEYAEFVYLAATAPENIAQLSHLADGGAYPAVRPEVVVATQVVQPSGSLLPRFSSLIRPLLTKSAQNERESRTLATLRDVLLPRLLSGELRVRAAEALVEGAI